MNQGIDGKTKDNNNKGFPIHITQFLRTVFEICERVTFF